MASCEVLERRPRVRGQRPSFDGSRCRPRGVKLVRCIRRGMPLYTSISGRFPRKCAVLGSRNERRTGMGRTRPRAVGAVWVGRTPRCAAGAGVHGRRHLAGGSRRALRAVAGPGQHRDTRHRPGGAVDRPAVRGRSADFSPALLPRPCRRLRRGTGHLPGRRPRLGRRATARPPASLGAP